MSYQVLARKWRPRTFQEMVGQEHVVRALSNALDNDRLHHAYLFTGTRGVGKTTLARIFAKSLNCERGVSSTPCGECSICREVDEGRFVDLLEVDAASRTKVDQTRELLDNVPYAPVRGRYKVYLIDEVHMFSGGSFNALLKTLEEPPPHVKFLLATTDPQKVPVTVLSRCLQFNLKRLPFQQIRDYLRQILEQEQVEHELPALDLLARGADGSMRDALSLMDQAIAFGGGRVREAEVRSMLGTIARERVHDLLDALAAGDAAGVMRQVGELAEMAPDFAGVLQDLLTLLHRVALAQAVPDALDDSSGDGERVKLLAQGMDPADVQLFYQIGLLGQRDLPLAPDPRSGFEMVLLRMLAFRPDGTDGGAAAGGPEKRARTGAPALAGTAGSAPASRKQPVQSAAAGPAPEPAQKAVIDGAGFEQWEQLVGSLQLGGIALQLASNCLFHSWQDGVLRLRLAASHANLRVGSSEQRLKQALERHLGASLRLEIEVGELEQDALTPAQRQSREKEQRQQALEESMARDPLVQSLQEQFDARLVPGSVRPAQG
ncbi:MAG TPA: DNA polymerase III subunit gamma/tau [Sedimenticola thiotaurini]|uniref:DNA polymerase III subunit gamma/tau n=1 Tax=Sedimenticola thiotaurini TaxID=1543721 RepID=A0A831RLJ2_9GAMM|nr:DNA polymerase III subunit gamma/tau [Sedimenticola thiotaurini]